MSSTADRLDEFVWSPQPEAAALVQSLLAEAISASPALAAFEARLQGETGTRLTDWIDHIALPAGHHAIESLSTVGFVAADESRRRVWRHPGGMFPPIAEKSPAGPIVATRAESLADFAEANGSHGWTVGGEPGDALRIAAPSQRTDATWQVVERHGTHSLDLPSPSATPADLAKARESLKLRNRGAAGEEAPFDALDELAQALVSRFGAGRACDLFFASERDYWQRRNRAAQVQHARQGGLGLGWANHDHHTYRSSRQYFHRLVRVFETLGFVCRERFYAGKDAGWGAQVMEHPTAGIVTFNDVDLAPHEVLEDFAHEPLEERRELGTVGLWCRLHGESLFAAGMHHLECQFDFDAASSQLRQAGIEIMPPFTNLPHLRQAFTRGETWSVDPLRVDAALAAGQITAEQADKFRQSGALGSHLEILERNDGFKGFNQHGVSDIIRRTDPRRS